MGYFKIKETSHGEYVAQYFASNGELVWWTEGYKSKSSAKHAIDILKEKAVHAELREE